MERNIGNVSEDFITCSICKDEFKEPKSLPCLHSYCKKCITDHIVKSTKSQRAPTGFNCPTCKRFTDAPDPHQPQNLWSDMLPASHLIISLMDGVKLRNDVSKCDPCFRRQEKVIAAKWCKECAEPLCEQCVSFHRSLKYSQNHTLMEFEELRHQPIRNTLPRPPCPQHENTTLGFFCEDHQHVCCSSCVTIDHRKCAHVTTSVDAAAKHRANIDALVEKLRHQNGWSARILENRQHSVKILDDAETQLKNQINSVRHQFEELLQTQEKRVLEELRAIKVKEAKEYEREILKCEEMLCTTGNALNILKNSQQHGTDADILLSVNSVKKEAKQCEKDLSEMSSNLRDIILIFTPDRHLTSLLGSLKEIGKISYSHSLVQVTPPYNIAIESPEPSSVLEAMTPETPPVVENQERHRKLDVVYETPRSSRMSVTKTSRSESRHSRHSRNSRHENGKLHDETPRSKMSRMSDIFQATIESIEDETPRHQTLLSPMTPMGRQSNRRISLNSAKMEFCFKARSPQDRENCILTGATYLHDGRVILVDQMLRKLKLYDATYKWFGEKVLPARPYDICESNENEVAVSFPKERRIQLYTVRQTDFILISTINTGAKCWGLSYSLSIKKFAVCCYTQPPSIKMFSRSDGRETKMLSRDRNGMELFFFPDYIAMDASGRNLYVTDKYKKSVIGITSDGDKKWETTYHGLKNPRGIAVHGNRIYVAGCRSHSVVLLTIDGDIVGDIIMDGISFPNKICLSPKSDRLLITQFQGTLIDIERNTVKIYRID